MDGGRGGEGEIPAAEEEMEEELERGKRGRWGEGKGEREDFKHVGEEKRLGKKGQANLAHVVEYDVLGTVR